MKRESDVRTSIWRRFKWAFKAARARLAEDRGDFERAWGLLDEAEQIWPLRPKHRVQRARLLLRKQLMKEAGRAFLALRDELKGAEHPDQKYLRHYCTYMLALMSGTSSVSQCAYEAKQAKLLRCTPSLKRDFPMMTSDEMLDAVPPKPE